ncbi:CesT family type III secretion system chaperone [Paraburkholderia phenazinium]|uniref:Tir chaperone protein (CesT) family protein n=1 Tax=Paraburkholderia phenazinium TaxID=60549 RepID=A0A1G8K9H8_9BURK|nr:CesT family type III secretion system chaperone [Paraburkholderia phenazinium]SDI40105.1 Tir chaperone protein (CesT) family protein [Paraburkholderia phenazinium]
MSLERRDQLIRELCDLRGIGDAEHVITHGVVCIDDFDIAIDYFDEDPAAIYVNFQFGVISGGRTLRVFRLLLEANLSVYAQDQAQLGVEAETGGVVLVVRGMLDDDADGPWLVEMIEHYVEHGRYWRENILLSDDEMFRHLSDGAYIWIRA